MIEPARSLSSSRSDSSQVSGIDLLGVLEGRIESLVGRYRGVAATVEELTAQLADRDLRIRELEKRLGGEKRKRLAAHKRVEGLIGQVEHMMQTQA